MGFLTLKPTLSPPPPAPTQATAQIQPVVEAHLTPGPTVPCPCAAPGQGSQMHGGALCPHVTDEDDQVARQRQAVLLRGRTQAPAAEMPVSAPWQSPSYASPALLRHVVPPMSGAHRSQDAWGSAPAWAAPGGTTPRLTLWSPHLPPPQHSAQPLLPQSACVVLSCVFPPGPRISYGSGCGSW